MPKFLQKKVSEDGAEVNGKRQPYSKCHSMVYCTKPKNPLNLVQQRTAARLSSCEQFSQLICVNLHVLDTLVAITCDKKDPEQSVQFSLFRPNTTLSFTFPKKTFILFSKYRPSGPMLSISRNVRRSVCPSVCLSVHF